MYKIYFIFIPKIIPKTFCLLKSGCFYPFLDDFYVKTSLFY